MGTLIKTFLSAIAKPQFTVGVGDTTGTEVALKTNLLGDVKAATSTATVTISNATPANVTHSAHGMTTGDKVYFTTTGALPTGLSVNTTYYLAVNGSGSYNLAATLAAAKANTPLIATSSAGSGVHTVNMGGFTMTSGLPATRTNDNATAGYVGEYTSLTLLRTNRITISNANAAADVIAGGLPLTAGDWDVGGRIGFLGNAATITLVAGDISLTTATQDHDSLSKVQHYPQANAFSTADVQITLGDKRVTVAAGTTSTAFLVAAQIMSGGTNQVYGTIWARRVR